MYDHLSKLHTTVKICRITQGVGERAQSWLEQLLGPVVSYCVCFPPVLEFSGTVCPLYPKSIHLTLMLSFIFPASNFPWGNLLRKKLIFSNWGMWFEILILGDGFISSVAWWLLMVMRRISVGSLVGKFSSSQLSFAHRNPGTAVTGNVCV